MVGSFSKRTLIPQVFLLAILPLLHVLLPVRPVPTKQIVTERLPNGVLHHVADQADVVNSKNMGICIFRFLLFMVTASVSWLVAFLASGVFIPVEQPKPQKEESRLLMVLLWVGVVFFTAGILLAWVPFILYWIWLIQFVAFLATCIPLYNVFRSRLGPSVLEAIGRHQQQRAERRKREDELRIAQQELRVRVRQYDRQIADCEKEIKRRTDSTDERDQISLIEFEEKLAVLREERAVLLDSQH